MPLHQNLDGTWQWGKSGKKYKKKLDAVKQMKAIFANGYVEKKASYSGVLLLRKKADDNSLRSTVDVQRNQNALPYNLIQDNTTGFKTHGFGFPPTTVTALGKPVESLGVIYLPTTPLTFSRALFRPGETGSDALRRLHNATQRARRNAGGKEYLTGIYDIPIPWLKPDTSLKFWRKGDPPLEKKVRDTLRKIRGIKPEQDYTGFYHITKTPERAYTSTQWRPGLLPLNELSSGGGTVFHENTGHDYTRAFPVLDTLSLKSALIPYFLFGDEAQTPISIKKLKNMWTARKLFPRYGGKYPISYYNSIPEFLAAASTQKKALAAGHGIVSTGINRDLSDRARSEGAIPFNTAMVNTGLWKVNPKYKGWTGLQYQPKYIQSPEFFKKLHNALNPQVNPSGDLRHTLWRENELIMNQINFMQYLIDLGPQRTSKQEEALRYYQERLPYLLEMARNQQRNTALQENERALLV